MTERKAIELVGSMGEDGHEVADPFEHCKGGVAFVEMQHLRLPAERQQDSIAADARAGFPGATAVRRRSRKARW